MIWIALIEFLLVMTPTSIKGLVDIHIFLGVFIIGLAFYNFGRLRGTSVPGRVKRIARATGLMTVLAAIFGVLLYSNLGSGWTLFFGVTMWEVFLFLHDLTAFAIITQAAAVAFALSIILSRASPLLVLLPPPHKM